jgi:hypothetical protein
MTLVAASVASAAAAVITSSEVATAAAQVELQLQGCLTLQLVGL